MQRLRTTFKRARTPTAYEMKTQSSLEVPKQVRSASFDEIQLEAKRMQSDKGADSNTLLSIPQFPGQRSRSVDSGGSEESGNFLEVPSRKFHRRRSSGSKSPICVHCICLEEYNRMHSSDSSQDEKDKDDMPQPSFSMSESSSECEEEILSNCGIRVTLSPEIPPEPIQSPPPVPMTPTQSRRKSIHRQEAFFGEPSGDSLESISDANSEAFSSDGAVSAPAGLVVKDIYLQVPDLKRDRAASVDSCFSKVSQVKTEELEHSGVSLEVPVGPNVALRSRSVDIVLPTDKQARYKALAMAAPCNSEYRKSSEVGERVLRSTPDWEETAINGDHLWVPTSVSGDFCYVGDSDCTKHGPRMKCSACNIIAHQSCIKVLVEKVKFFCKPTFKDVGVRQYREQTTIQHHWVHRRSEKGKCRRCSKSFQSKLSFSSKEIVAISCSWCKAAYHNKESCFNIKRIGEECTLGVHCNSIVPPSWIVKLPKKGNFKSSLRKSPKKRTSVKKNKHKDKEHRIFAIKPIPSTNVSPVIVFINPKSGGNQGLKLLQKFQWLLNPRQVFDLTQGGPRMGLELFKKVPNLRVLACGGDGTVGWVLSVIDQIGISPAPAVGVLPLGTGNDLARALGWGGGYTDEPISKILSNISQSDIVNLDRWSLDVEKNKDAPPPASNEPVGKESLPLNVVNNYYSLGVDAHIALEFHEAREAHPEKFNSRLRNKMFYGQMGGKDLLKRKWKDLADFVILECDGQNITQKLKELRVHAIVFLNISSYGGGTHPWNRSMGTHEPNTDDGLIEVVGLTTYQLPLLQAGGHGTCITQCRSAKITTSKTIPMQVDGEACKLGPSIITLSHLNKAPMLAKRKFGKPVPIQTALDNLNVGVNKLTMSDYEQHHYDKDLLAQAAINIGKIEVSPGSDLEQVRAMINTMLEENKDKQMMCSDWCFIDSCTAERFFRIDKAQESLHYVVDICSENLYILECGDETVPPTPEDETANPSPTSNHQTSYNIPEMRISKEDDLDSPSDHPPLSPRNVDSQEEFTTSPDEGIPIDNQQLARVSSDASMKIRSITERLFGLNQDSYNAYSYLDEKPNESLLIAAKKGDIRMVKQLHNQGYSLLTKDSTGQTMLHHAARYGHPELVKYLIRFAPSMVNEKDSKLSQTALHKAVLYKWHSICCILIAGGAALDIKDHRGLTPRLLALHNNDQELAAYLESQEKFQLVSSNVGTEV
ncbi:eye-specific diacylglycerol kinase isoform X1 [Diabrotica virgifera virgifera]|uniref:Diacylglycerol kinase n=2 Tax=Diabrotica virgifera virgifera TaxID=50390 RepID=A0ABM5JJF9_DIAVI|nr:eye-specific diacylglycerol kinase isoform X1 [Diabrotica virgifera virgifera]